MAKFDLVSLIWGLLFCVKLVEHCNGSDLQKCNIDKVYQLGDSFSDTGNYIRESSGGANSAFSRLPYGQDFDSKKPTGRCSNGRLIIDYIAMAYGVAYLNPYQDRQASFRNGNNFGTVGATALPTQFLSAKNISSPFTSTSLDVQLDLLFTHFNSICLRDCTELLKSGLVMVGEIGMNDYSFALLQDKTLQETTSLVSDVVFAIQKAITTVIQFGAVRIVVPGVLPIGCLPIHLTKFANRPEYSFDENLCLKEINDLAKNHNQKLLQAIEEVKKEQPNVTIVYGDYYNSYLSLMKNAPQLGFDPKTLRKACCGTGGNHNFDSERLCGSQGVSVCSNPDAYLSWDGTHLTQQAYKDIAQSLIQQISPFLKCKP